MEADLDIIERLRNRANYSDAETYASHEAALDYEAANVIEAQRALIVRLQADVASLMFRA